MIAVVDDPQDARESVAAILERAGATVLTAGSALVLVIAGALDIDATNRAPRTGIEPV